MSSKTFGHASSGYAVQFNFAGMACETLVVETRPEAETLKDKIEREDETDSARIVSK